MYKVEVAAGDIEQAIQQFQANLRPLPFLQFYCHFYRGNELIVVFKEKVFRMTTDRPTWGDALAYGRSLGIPDRQLDFFPCRWEEEPY